MTTSGDTAWKLTARDIAHEALWENAIIPLSDDMEAVELERVITRLNAMMKSWQAQGILWKQETISVAGAANHADITLPVAAREVNGARLVQGATRERTLYRWERDEYLSLPNKASVGAPTAYCLQRKADAVVVTVWPVPNAAYTLSLDVERAFDTVTNGAQTVDFPEELTETLYANLAVRCAGIFGASLAPELVERARRLERQMLDDWRPSSYTFGYDC